MVIDTSQIITGEKIQSIADIYIGDSYYFTYNPLITVQYDKQKRLSDFNNMTKYDNPRIVFCYGDLINDFYRIMHLFLNPFVLITHNSDENIVKKEIVDNILNCPNLIRWHAQNVGYIHEKLYFVPIGIANAQWPHGNLKMYKHIFENYNIQNIKRKNFFMNFKIDTNIEKRMKCYEELHKWVPFLPLMPAIQNLIRMIEYKFCICPEGNGLDTHRLWECFYLQIVPIVLRNTFTENIQKKTGLPMILLDSWKELTVNVPKYDSFDFNKSKEYLCFEYYKEQIIS